MSTSPFTKPARDRSTLSAHGVEIVESFFESKPERGLPKHVDALRRALMDFERSIDIDWEKKLREDYEELTKTWSCETRTATQQWNLLPPDIATCLTRHKSANLARSFKDMDGDEKVASSARELRNELEPGCTNFLRREIFLDFPRALPSYTQHE